MTESKQQQIQHLANIFIQSMPFSRLLQLELEQLSSQSTVIYLPWQQQLVGNPIQQILHGGVISAVLDTVGGLMAAAAFVERQDFDSVTQMQDGLAKLGTIDMRTDYLRPGRGEKFYASAEPIRLGNKVCVCRMELHNEKDVKIAYGTGTYLFG